jgi:hypothetical protein
MTQGSIVVDISAAGRRLRDEALFLLNRQGILVSAPPAWARFQGEIAWLIKN